MKALQGNTKGTKTKKKSDFYGNYHMLKEEKEGSWKMTCSSLSVGMIRRERLVK